MDTDVTTLLQNFTSKGVTVPNPTHMAVITYHGIRIADRQQVTFLYSNYSYGNFNNHEFLGIE